MKSILAIVASQEIQHFLRNTLERSYNLTVCNYLAEGALLLQKMPDILILELQSADFLIQYAKSLPPVVIALTTVYSQSVIGTAENLGVDLLVRIPCTGALIRYILDDF